MFADFVFGSAEPATESPFEVRIVSLLPNPEGQDKGHEQVTIGNFTASDVNLDGWKLQDRAGNHFELTGTIPANDTLLITMHKFSMPLNNSGDDVTLSNLQGGDMHHVSYSAADAQSGKVVTFDSP